MLCYQNLLLWRHADALSHSSVIDSDMARALSPKGVQQAHKMAKWLDSHLPQKTIVLSSAALRAQQTTQALGREYMVIESLAPEAKLATVLQALNSAKQANTETENLLIIGHQPWLGLLAAHLLNLPQKFTNETTEVSIKKGAVWWFTRATEDTNLPFKLKTVQTPSLL